MKRKWKVQKHVCGYKKNQKRDDIHDGQMNQESVLGPLSVSRNSLDFPFSFQSAKYVTLPARQSSPENRLDKSQVSTAGFCEAGGATGSETLSCTIQS